MLIVVQSTRCTTTASVPFSVDEIPPVLTIADDDLFASIALALSPHTALLPLAIGTPHEQINGVAVPRSTCSRLARSSSRRRWEGDKVLSQLDLAASDGCWCPTSRRSCSRHRQRGRPRLECRIDSDISRSSSSNSSVSLIHPHSLRQRDAIKVQQRLDRRPERSTLFRVCTDRRHHLHDQREDLRSREVLERWVVE